MKQLKKLWAVVDGVKSSGKSGQMNIDSTRAVVLKKQ